jgi:ribosomal protein S27AE
MKDKEPWNKGKKGLQKAWNKGLKFDGLSDEHKKNISEALKKKHANGEIKTNKGKEPWNKGKKGVQKAWNKGIKLDKFECPHCGKFVDLANGKRWHFDNCKFKT